MRALFLLALLALLCAASQAGRPKCHGKWCKPHTRKPKPCWWCHKTTTVKPTTTAPPPPPTTTTKKPSCPWGVHCCKYDSDCKGDVSPCAKLVCVKKSSKDWYKVCKVVPDTVKPSFAKKCEKCPPPVVCCTDTNPCPDKGKCNAGTNYKCPPPKPTTKPPTTTTTPAPTTTTTTTKPPPKCDKDYSFDSYDKCFKTCPKDQPDECRKCDVVEDPHAKGCYACVCKAVSPCCSTKNPKLGCSKGGKCYDYACKMYKNGPYSTCVKELSFVAPSAARCSGSKCPSTNCCRPGTNGPYCDKGYKCSRDYECVKGSWKLA